MPRRDRRVVGSGGQPVRGGIRQSGQGLWWSESSIFAVEIIQVNCGVLLHMEDNWQICGPEADKAIGAGVEAKAGKQESLLLIWSIQCHTHKTKFFN